MGDDDTADGNLPNDVSRDDQLSALPAECRSGNRDTPLRHVDDQGNVYQYALRPMSYSVVFILMVELLERLSFYGIYYTQTLYLTGVYNRDWNAGVSSVDAAAFVSASTAVAYTTPFLGAILADTVLGDYWSILVGSLGLYLPGVTLIALTSVPYLLGPEFNRNLLSWALMVLWPCGTGIIKSVINVFGAKQFHPILQASLIEQYYVNFYMVINIGALIGIMLIPILAQHNVTLAYMVPSGMLSVGVAIFLCGTQRYVIGKPRGDLFKKMVTQHKTESPTSAPASLWTVFRITMLIVPFSVAYSQMPTTFIVQGTVMRKAFGVIDAATMNSVDALSVLVLGSLTGNCIYPALARRHIKLATAHKFAIGSFLGAMALAWALLVEHWIHESYQRSGFESETHSMDNEDRLEAAKISVLWQAPSYMLIAWGEIFAVSTAYEVAFSTSAPSKKALASAVNIFCIGGIPNAICIVLYKACNAWFRNTTRGDNNLQELQDYATASVYKYFLVLLGILAFGFALNLRPGVRKFVESAEQGAADLLRTPMVGRKPPTERMVHHDERTPLVLHRKQTTPIDQLKGPVLYKMGSMRAGPTLSGKECSPSRAVKKSYIPVLYKSGNAEI